MIPIFLSFFVVNSILNGICPEAGNVDGGKGGINFGNPIRGKQIFHRKGGNVQNNNVFANVDEIHDYLNFVYTMTINLGSPPQQFDVLIDTGSSSFWLIAPECCDDFQNRAMCPPKCDRINKIEGSECPMKCPKKFFNNESNSFEATNGYFNASYVDKSGCSGFVGKDVLRFGPIDKKSALAIPGTFVGLANKIDKKSEYSREFDGLMGLGFTGISANIPKVDPPLIDAMKRGILKENVFSVYLKTEKLRNGEIVHGGELTIGSIDTENCGQIFGWAQLTEARFWKFNIEGISQDGQSIQAETIPAISDTGTTLIYGPYAILERIIGKIGKIQISPVKDDFPIYLIPCDHEYGPIEFKIGGNEYSLTKDVLTIPIGGGKCLFGMRAHKRKEWNLGAPFIRQFCHIYDMGNERIGFAEVK